MFSVEIAFMTRGEEGGGGVLRRGRRPEWGGKIRLHKSFTGTGTQTYQYRKIIKFDYYALKFVANFH